MQRTVDDPAEQKLEEESDEGDVPPLQWRGGASGQENVGQFVEEYLEEEVDEEEEEEDLVSPLVEKKVDHADDIVSLKKTRKRSQV